MIQPCELTVKDECQLFNVNEILRNTLTASVSGHFVIHNRMVTIDTLLPSIFMFSSLKVNLLNNNSGYKENDDQSRTIRGIFLVGTTQNFNSGEDSERF